MPNKRDCSLKMPPRLREGIADAVYTYLARVVVNGEPVTQVSSPGGSIILPAWTAAAMLVSLLPEGAGT
jgi:hypothetical protein